MRLIDADHVLEGIEELKRSPWFNRGKDVSDQALFFPHIGYIERKEAVEVVRDLCINKEPTIGGWISVKDRMPEPPAQCLVYSDKSYRPCGMETATYTNLGWMTAVYFPEITHWMPLPETPKEDEGNG